MRSVLILFILLSVSPLRAATLRVPVDYGTIQAGVDAAAVGDTVLVAPGTYSEIETRQFHGGGPFLASAIIFLKPGVSVISEGGSGVTTIDMLGQGGGLLSHCVMAYLQPGEAMLLQGFRITGAPSGFSGAYVAYSASLVLRDCVFDSLDGVGGERPGGLYAVDGELVSMYDCSFLKCLGSPSGAGGVRAILTSLLAEDCTFEGGSGGADYLGSGSSGPSAVFRRCRFIDNVGGGGLNLNGPQVTVEDCWFEGNSANGGGALDVDYVMDMSIRRNVFVNNSALAVAGASIENSFGSVVANTFHGNSDQIEWRGAHLYVDDDPGQVTIENNIFSGARGSHAVHVPQAIISSSCNVFWDNPLGNVNINYPWDPTDTIQDPQFCDPDAGDFSVESNSPCLPANSGTCGQIGAFGQGCGSVAVEPESWSKIKGAYR
ncbi:right-handed parallel beta-helix repeat-containing protein [bacterium]|nr:right-handed parallel beta-helix repeat-containing protein [bacterium]